MRLSLFVVLVPGWHNGLLTGHTGGLKISGCARPYFRFAGSRRVVLFGNAYRGGSAAPRSICAGPGLSRRWWRWRRRRVVPASAATSVRAYTGDGRWPERFLPETATGENVCVGVCSAWTSFHILATGPRANGSGILIVIVFYFNFF